LPAVFDAENASAVNGIKGTPKGGMGQSKEHLWAAKAHKGPNLGSETVLERMTIAGAVIPRPAAALASKLQRY